MTISRFLCLIAAMLVPLGLQSQGARYEHPVYDFSFEATPNWTEHFKVNHSAVYSVVNPNHNMEISITYVPECKKPRKYMKKLSGLKGLVCKRDGYDTILNDYEALVFYGNCLKYRDSFTTMVLGFPVGEGLYIMEINCPENCHIAHRKKLQSILSTIRIGKDSTI